MDQPTDSHKSISFAGLILLVIALAGVGVAGYMVIEGWGWLDALYMVVTTLGTVGFQEVHPLSPAGRTFTITLIILGFFVLYFVVRLVGEYVLENKLDEYLSRNKMERNIQRFANHYIICGFGRVGRHIATELSSLGAQFVVVDSDPAALLDCERLGYACVAGDATEERVLGAAGIVNAKSLIVALGQDSATILTIVTARGMNKDLFIVARANGENTASKLMKIGANRVVAPHQIGAFRMAGFALNPATADFLDDVQDLTNQEVQISDIVVASSSGVVGQAIAQKLSGRALGITVLAIHKPDGNAIINPIGDTIIEAGDRLILLGTRDKITAVLTSLNPKAIR